jgi:hypothetical protein
MTKCLELGSNCSGDNTAVVAASVPKPYILKLRYLINLPLCITGIFALGVLPIAINGT